jgi:hypothetical protein
LFTPKASAKIEMSLMNYSGGWNLGTMIAKIADGTILRDINTAVASIEFDCVSNRVYVSTSVAEMPTLKKMQQTPISRSVISPSSDSKEPTIEKSAKVITKEDYPTHGYVSGGGGVAPAPVAETWPWVQILVKGGNRLLTGPPIIYGIKRKVGQALPTGWIHTPVRATATCALGSGATAGKVVSTTLTNIGNCYPLSPALPPVVTVSAPPIGGTQAVITAAASDGGYVEGAYVTNCGTLYKTVEPSPPSVTFSAPPSGTTATGSAVVRDGLVVAINVINRGSGYVTEPSITITAATGDAGTSATATCVLGKGKVALTITNQGAGYVTAPTLSIEKPFAYPRPALPALPLPAPPSPVPPQIADDSPTAWADGMGWGIIQGGSLTGGFNEDMADLIVHDDRALVPYGLSGEGGAIPNPDSILSWYRTKVKLSVQDINANGVLEAWVAMAGGA